MRGNNQGKCKLCGEYKTLTFEHVPPESAFNNYSVKVISGEELFKPENEDRLPWDSSGLKGNIQQRGRGGYYLCQECNNNTGSWYIPAYTKFIRIMGMAISEVSDQQYSSIEVSMKDIKPLQIFKSIMTMFCDINHNCFGDEDLRHYLLTKESTSFNSDKYRVFAYVYSGSVERINGYTALGLVDVGVVCVSEIACFPLGFALYINKPDNFEPQGVVITEFSSYEYDQEYDLTICLPVLECNSNFPMDYRSQEEIEQCIEDSKRWLEENTNKL